MNSRERAIEVLRSTDLLITSPVDVVSVAEAVGLVVCIVDRESQHALTFAEELSGALDFASGTIWIAGWESSARKRYTIAHEIGHEVLGHEQKLQDKSRSDSLETEADDFASELLMPRSLIQDALVRHGGALVPLLAREFDVSIRAMERRLENELPPVQEIEWVE